MEETLPKDCYWFVKESEDESNRMAACCVSCGRQRQLGWFWKGSVMGYGENHNLDCSICGAAINKYDDNNNKEEITPSS